jgi:hypothetical protein
VGDERRAAFAAPVQPGARIDADRHVRSRRYSFGGQRVVDLIERAVVQRHARAVERAAGVVQRAPSFALGRDIDPDPARRPFRFSTAQRVTDLKGAIDHGAGHAVG